MKHIMVCCFAAKESAHQSILDGSIVTEARKAKQAYCLSGLKKIQSVKWVIEAGAKLEINQNILKGKQ